MNVLQYFSHWNYRKSYREKIKVALLIRAGIHYYCLFYLNADLASLQTCRFS